MISKRRARSVPIVSRCGHRLILPGGDLHAGIERRQTKGPAQFVSCGAKGSGEFRENVSTPPSYHGRSPMRDRHQSATYQVRTTFRAPKRRD